MASSGLAKARELGTALRYGRDLPSQPQFHNDRSVADRQYLYQDAIEISSLLTPRLWERVHNACNRLSLPQTAASIFVYSSREVQAECLIEDDTSCVIRFSSGLVDLLDEDEFEFVIGHELGHFILSHRSVRETAPELSLEYFRVRRSQEISSDRLGLLACGSLDIALRALMKTVSGLTDRHLRFDVGAFISQLRKVEISSSYWSKSTHPSILMRAKALLWFSLSRGFSDGIDFVSPEEMQKLDARIDRDLQKYADGMIHRRIAALKDDVLMWMSVLEVVRSGLFSTAAQERMRTRFGDQTVQKLRSFLSDLPRMEAESITLEKLRTAREALEKLSPSDVIQVMRNLEHEAKGLLTTG